MQYLPWTAWVVAGLNALSIALETSGTVEVDLIFPRNETYGPTRYMPFIFAIQNPELAQYMNFEINYNVWNSNDTTEEQNMRQNNTVASGNVSLPSGDFSSNDPYFVHDFSAYFNVEGQYAILWRLYGYWCKEGAQNITLQLWTKATFFSISDSAQQTDLVAATGNETACLSLSGRSTRGMGQAMNVIGIHNAPETWNGGEKCVEMSGTNAVATPCRVKINEAAAVGIWASVNETMCRYRPYPGKTPPKDIECPSTKSGARKLVVGGLALLVFLGLLIHDPW